MAATLRKVTVATTATTVVPASTVISTGSRNVRFVNRSQVPVTLGNGDVLAPGGEKTLSLAYTSTFTCTAPTSTSLEVYDDHPIVGPQVIAAAATDVDREVWVSGEAYPRVRTLGGGGVPFTGPGTVQPGSSLPGVSLLYQTAPGPTYGVFPIPMGALTGGITMVTQRMWLMYFVAPYAVTISSVRCAITAYTATGHTYSAVGLYSEDADGGLTRQAATIDTGAPPTFLGSAALFTNSFDSSGSVALIAGQRYAVGFLTVFTGGSISILGGVVAGAVSYMAPDLNLGAGARIAMFVGSQATMPTTISNASLASGTGSGHAIGCRLVP